MRADDIFDAVGNVNEKDIEEAKAPLQKQSKLRPWLKWGTVAASFVLVIGIGVMAAIIFRGGNAGGGSNDGLTYMSYAGPVFPLTLKGEADITAERNVDLDFAEYSERDYATQIKVTDSYTLKNPTDSDITFTALYPYAGLSTDAPPTVTVNGETAETKVIAGGYNPDRMTSFADYERLVKGGKYPESIYREYPSLDGIPAVVYRLHDYVYTEDERATNPTLLMSFYIDTEKTFVYNYNMNLGRYNDESGYVARGTSSIYVKENADEKYRYPDDAFVIIVGEDIDGYTVKGYRDGGCDKGEEVEDLSCTVTRYESNLGDVLGYFLADFADEGYAVANDTETAMDLTAEMLSYVGALDITNSDQSYSNLENVFSYTRNSSRVMYLEFDVTVPAGGTVNVTSSMLKHASEDFVGENKDRHGYSVAASLGSSLKYDSQTASLSNTSGIEIVQDNFGFDLDSGITKVPLSQSVDHYYIDVKQKSIE